MREIGAGFGGRHGDALQHSGHKLGRVGPQWQYIEATRGIGASRVAGLEDICHLGGVCGVDFQEVVVDVLAGQLAQQILWRQPYITNQVRVTSGSG